MTSGIQGDSGLACRVTCKPHLGFADLASSSKDEEEGQLPLPLRAGWPTCSLSPLCGPHLVTARSRRVLCAQCWRSGDTYGQDALGVLGDGAATVRPTKDTSSTHALKKCKECNDS